MSEDFKQLLHLSTAVPMTPQPTAMNEESDEAILEEELEHELGINSDALNKISRVKQRLYTLLYSTAGEVTIFGMIVASVALLIVELALPSTLHVKGVGWAEALRGDAGWLFWFDVGFSVFFLVEYTLKLWIAPRKWYFIKTHWIDLLALLPVLRIFRIGSAVRLLRLLRLLRVLRVARLMRRRANMLSSEMQRRSLENMIVAAYLAFALLFGTLGILIFEKGKNPSFETLGDGLWWCVVTLTTVGYGDMTPQTPGGKIVAGVIMFTGLCFYALLTSLLSSVVIERSRKSEREGVDMESLSGHVVICGWNETGRKLVADLVESHEATHVLVMARGSTYPRLFNARVSYINEDTSCAHGLDVARAAFCKIAVILPDEAIAAQDADARSILTVLAIEQLNSKIHTIVELRNEENVYHVKNAGCDEVIVSGAYTSTMISQAVQCPGVSEVFEHMFSPGEGSHLNEIKLPRVHVGQAFSVVSRALFLEGCGIALGYRRAGQLHMTPEQDTHLGARDSIVMLTRRGA